MDCKRVKEKFVFLRDEQEMGQEVFLAFRRHVDHCPACARKARFTRRLLMLVRENAAPRPAPSGLRIRILASLPHRRTAT